MASFLESGHLIEVIMVLTVGEWLALAAFHQATGNGPAPGAIGLTILSGLFLLLALREALVSAWWGLVAASLIGALVSHIADLVRRWRGSSDR